MQFLSTTSLICLVAAVIGTPAPAPPQTLNLEHTSGVRLAARDKECWIIGKNKQSCVKSPNSWVEVGVLAPGARHGTTFGASCKKNGKKAWTGTNNKLFIYCPWYDCYVSEEYVDDDCKTGLPTC
ncbi:hypothetical protein QBC47DRAFT_410620 [Echria macrotheca]|uniref:Uncharacterized protein n=1 Tax=Echria macrotheca TaxID=438768 RepID=A0AAJ0FFI2_9PEZI|nr:hypothetical protein QBC47DRAFT_410620 [Echria macrotheca]